MFKLFQIFMKFSGFFIFLLLEILCFVLIVRYNHEHRVIFQNTTNLYSASLLEKKQKLSNYLHLQEQNDSLMVENTKLLQQLFNLNTAISPDSIERPGADSVYRVEPARVISNSINRLHNFIVLDKGTRHGIKPHSAVITADGVVGIVRRVSPSSCVAMSVLHLQTRISARVRNKGYFGSLTWTGRDTKSFTLNYIPKDALVAKGDTIETSGYSNIFPDGLILGTIEQVRLEPGNNYYAIDVSYHLNLGKLSQVYIVINLLQPEREEFLEAVLREDE